MRSTAAAGNSAGLSMTMHRMGPRAGLSLSALSAGTKNLLTSLELSSSTHISAPERAVRACITTARTQQQQTDTVNCVGNGKERQLQQRLDATQAWCRARVRLEQSNHDNKRRAVKQGTRKRTQ